MNAGVALRSHLLQEPALRAAAWGALTHLPSHPETPAPGLQGGLVGRRPQAHPPPRPSSPRSALSARVGRAGADAPLELIRKTLAEVSWNSS